MTKTYNRQDGETTKAYTAFTIYRDMGSARSLDRVEEKVYGTQTRSSTRTVPQKQ
jgi:hypothetical protein